jgi:hypothetical protein
LGASVVLFPGKEVSVHPDYSGEQEGSAFCFVGVQQRWEAVFRRERSPIRLDRNLKVGFALLTFENAAAMPFSLTKEINKK